MDTIFALSSGAPPAAIAVVRISGPRTAEALKALAGTLPEPRLARLGSLRDERGAVLDRGLMLWFPGPGTATGEDLAELHLHGGRAVVAAVEAALARRPGLRRAGPGEFTRRAFVNGRVDLIQAEGLADLLEAETEVQRAAALASAGGALSLKIEAWRARLVALSASLESTLDFADEGDVGGLPHDFGAALEALSEELEDALSAPAAETLREGFRVALAGPPNSGKSTLFNALVENEAAIASAIPGTTRDVLERPIALGGIPFTLVDMAGLRDEEGDEVERMGIARSRAEIARADLVLWLGPEGGAARDAWDIEAQIDRRGHLAKDCPRHRVSAVTGDGLDGLRRDLIAAASGALPKPGHIALNRRQRELLQDAANYIIGTLDQADALIMAEQLRLARVAFERMVGRTGTEDVLDALFSRFCIGK